MNEKRKVVVIDDSPIVRKMAEVALEEAGYEVYSAENGEEGLRITKEVIPSVILVDFIMPRMSGYQFCQAIKEDDELKNIPIILITAKGEDVGKKFLEKFGVIDYFIKPFRSADLVDKVNSIVERQKTIFQTSEEEGDLQVKEERISTLGSEDTFSIESVETSEQETILEANFSEIQLEDPLSKDIVESFEFQETTKPLEIQLPPSIKDEAFSIDSLNQLESENILDLTETETSNMVKEDIVSIEDVGSVVIEKSEPAIDSHKNDQRDKDDLREYILNISLIENSVEKVARKVLREEIQPIVQRSVTEILKQAGIIKVPDIILSGSIGIFSIKDILNLIAHNRLTSKLSILSETLNSDIYFLDGEIIFASTNKTNPLIDLDSIKNPSPESVIQIKNSIYDTVSEILQLHSGIFSIEKISLSDNLQSIPIHLSIPVSLIEASRRMDERVYSDLFDDKTIFFKLLRDSAIKNYNLNKSEMRIFACINGERTVGEIIDISGLPSLEAYRAFYVMLNGGIIDIFREGS